jgi:hypothetical protein
VESGGASLVSTATAETPAESRLRAGSLAPQARQLGALSGGFYCNLKQLARFSLVLDRVTAGSPNLGEEAVELGLQIAREIEDSGFVGDAD